MSFSEDIYSASAPSSEPMDDPLHRQDDEEEDDDHQMLSPTDGYFGGPGNAMSSQPRDSWQPSYSSTSYYPGAASSNVPHVPDVWVSDPSLEQGSTADSKAREAREERESNRRLNNSSPTTTPFEQGIPFPGASLHREHSSSYVPGHTRSSSGISSHHPSYHRYTPSSTSYATRTGRSGTFSSDRSYYSTPNDAPPAYTPGPNSPLTSTSSPNPARAYNTFSQGRSIMGTYPEETRGLLAHEPQTMADPSAHGGNDPPTWADRLRWRSSFLSWRNIKVALLVLILLGVTIGFLVSSITSIHKEKDRTHLNPPGSDIPIGGGDGNHGNVDKPVDTPIDSPDAPAGPPDAPAKPPARYPPYDNDLVWHGLDFCGGERKKGTEIRWDVDFSERRSLTIKQTMDEGDTSSTHDVRIEGDVVFRRSGSGTFHNQIVMETLMNDPGLELQVTWDRDSQTLEIVAPRALPSWSDDKHAPCVRVRITVWVPEGAVLNDLNVQNLHLGVKLLDNLSLQMEGYTHFETKLGSIKSAIDARDSVSHVIQNGAPETFQFTSRYIRVQTISSNIAGAWPLYDHLSLESYSGDIRAHVDCEPVLKKKPAPANLFVKTLSGNVEIWEAIADAQQTQAGGEIHGLVAKSAIPPRDYLVEISSVSGSLKGAVAVGSWTKMHTESGDMKYDLLPVLDKNLASSKDKSAELETSSSSGTTTISMLEPLWVDLGKYTFSEAPFLDPLPDESDYIPVGNDDPYKLIPTLPSDSSAQKKKQEQDAVSRALRKFVTRHGSTSADIKLVYPRAWEGDLDIKSISGSIAVRGKGVIISSSKTWPVNKHISGHKGEEDGGSSLDIKTIAGAVNLLIGEP